MLLTTNRLVLRPIEPRDTDAMFAIMRDPETMRFWDWPPVASRDAVAGIVGRQAAETEGGTGYYWAVCMPPTDEVIGSCDLSEIDVQERRAEVGFLFRRTMWGQGFAFEAMQAIVVYGLGTLGLERLWARCHAGNQASVKLLERLGFTYEGTLKAHVVREGARRDCLIFGMVRLP